MSDTARKRFENLLEPIIDTAYRMALHMAKNPDDAADIVQESALRAYRSFHTFQEGTNFKAWFFRIVTNYFLEWARKRQRERIISDEEDVLVANYEGNTAQSEQMNPVSTVHGQMRVAQVRSAIGALPEEYRIVASLYFMDEFSYQEIADIVNCPVGTVRSRLHRGRRLLKRSLRSMAEQRGIVEAAFA